MPVFHAASGLALAVEREIDFGKYGLLVFVLDCSTHALNMKLTGE